MAESYTKNPLFYAETGRKRPHITGCKSADWFCTGTEGSLIAYAKNSLTVLLCTRGTQAFYKPPGKACLVLLTKFRFCAILKVPFSDACRIA